MKSQRKIKNFLINPRFQLKYIFWTTLWGLLLIISNALVFYFYTSENYQIFIELNDITPEAKAVLYEELYIIVTKLVVFSSLFLIIVSAMGIQMGHKVAGPMYKFKMIFEKIKQGDHSQRIHLRPKDEFRDVADEFNKMMDELSNSTQKNR